MPISPPRNPSIELAQYKEQIASNMALKARKPSALFTLGNPTIQQFALPNTTSLFTINQGLDAAFGQDFQKLIVILEISRTLKTISDADFSAMISTLDAIASAIANNNMAQAFSLESPNNIAFMDNFPRLTGTPLAKEVFGRLILGLLLGTVITACIIIAQGIAIPGLVVLPLILTTLLGCCSGKENSTLIGLGIGILLTAALITALMWATIPMLSLILPLAITAGLGLVSAMPAVFSDRLHKNYVKSSVENTNYVTNEIHKNMYCFFSSRGTNPNPVEEQLLQIHQTTEWKPAQASP